MKRIVKIKANKKKTAKYLTKILRIVFGLLLVIVVGAGLYWSYVNNKISEIYNYLKEIIVPITITGLKFLGNNIQILGIIFLVIVIIGIVIWGIRKIKKKKKEEEVPLEKARGNTTTIDRVYEAIKESKKIELNKLSKKISFPEEKIIAWCEILEKNNLITIEYPAFSSPIISIKEEKNES